MPIGGDHPIYVGAGGPNIERNDRCRTEDRLSNPIVYLEIEASYPPRLAAFYAELFGWTFRNPGETTYSVFQSGDGGIGGGICQRADRQVGRNLIPYVQVSNIEQACELAQKLGGRVSQPKQEIPGTGWSAQIFDPDGNLIGLFTPLE